MAEDRGVSGLPFDARLAETLIAHAQLMCDHAKGEITDAADDRLIDAVDALIALVRLLTEQHHV